MLLLFLESKRGFKTASVPVCAAGINREGRRQDRKGTVYKSPGKAEGEGGSSFGLGSHRSIPETGAKFI